MVKCKSRLGKGSAFFGWCNWNFLAVIVNIYHGYGRREDGIFAIGIMIAEDEHFVIHGGVALADAVC